MGLTFFQRIRLGLKGWSRRQADDAAKRDAEFLRRETKWASPSTLPPPPQPKAKRDDALAIDREGLQVAFLDDSGRIDYFLDRVTGEVVDFPSSDVAAADRMMADAPRFARVPRRTEESEAADRQAFVAQLEQETERARLTATLGSPNAATDFRKAVALDRGTEKAWYNFKNDRANEVIETWLASGR